MPKKRTPAKTKAETEERRVPLVWSFPDDLVSGYATNMLVQSGDNELYVSFFESPPPVLFTPDDAKSLESVKAECIARIVISPDRMPKFIEALQKQLDGFNLKKAAKKRAEAK